MLDVILETLIDSLKLIPFLFIAFIIIEFIEHKLTEKNSRIIKKSGRFGPIIGSILGAFPQCGFSVAMTNLYSTRIISLGTLIAVYLSTSDEMLPILISEKAPIAEIFKIIGLKVLIGIIFGFIIDFILNRTKRNSKDTETIENFCEKEHCHCERGILKSSIVHTLKIALFILIVSFILNTILHYLGEDVLQKMFLKGNIFGVFIASLIGLIPNCASSVAITQLFLADAITFGSTMAGLLTGSGIGILLLFKTNKNMKENLTILGLIYGIGVFCGALIDVIGSAFI